MVYEYKQTGITKSCTQDNSCSKQDSNSEAQNQMQNDTCKVENTVDNSNSSQNQSKDVTEKNIGANLEVMTVDRGTFHKSHRTVHVSSSKRRLYAC